MSSNELISYFWNEKGGRSYNEDRSVIRPLFIQKTTINSSKRNRNDDDEEKNIISNRNKEIAHFNVAFFAVFDGHGGQNLSRYLKHFLPDKIRNKLLQLNDDEPKPEQISQILKDAFLECNLEIESIYDKQM